MPKGIPRKTSGIRYQHTITVGRKFGKNRVIKMEAKPSRVTSTVTATTTDYHSTSTATTSTTTAAAGDRSVLILLLLISLVNWASNIVLI